MNTRIYKVEVGPVTAIKVETHLVQAVSATQAIRNVSKKIIQAKVAAQSELVELTKAGTEVEYATIPVKE